MLSRFGTPRRPRTDGDGERLWAGPSTLDPIAIRLPAKPSLVVICPKPAPLDWWCAGGGVPRGVALVASPRPSEARVRPVLQALSRVASAAVFVGDMDPYAVVQYVETRRSLAEAKGPPLLFGGVDDAWLVAMERTLKRGTRLESLRIPLARHEVSLLRQLDHVVDLERVIGPRGCSILRAGHKIELEGATHPGLYGPGHARWIFRYLRSRVNRGGSRRNGT